MRKIKAILFLSLTLLTFIGGRLLFWAQQSFIKYQQELRIVQNLPDSLLTEFTDADSIVWEEDGKEFYYKGDLYDVVRTHSEKGHVHFLSVKDGDETRLIKNYTKQFPNQSKRPHSRVLPLSYYFQNYCIHVVGFQPQQVPTLGLYEVPMPGGAPKEILIPPPNC